MRHPYLTCALAILLSACHSGSDGGGGGGGQQGPSNLTYSTPDGRYLVQVEIPDNVPSVKGAVSSWSVAPALPPGLTLDPLTGVISGTPSALAPRTAHVVEALGPGGKTTVAIQIAVDKPPRFVFAAGPTDDSLSAFVVDARSGQLHHHGFQLSAASQVGPEHVMLHPGGQFAFVPNRGLQNTPSTVSTYALDHDRGLLTYVGEAATGERPQRMALSPTSDAAYVITYADHFIWSYAVNPATGALTLLSTRLTNTGPERLAVHPAGRFVYVTHGPSADVTIFEADPVTGALGPRIDGINYWGFEPTDVVIEPGGRFAYIAFEGVNMLLAYAIDPLTGALNTLVELPTAGLPRDLAIPAHGDFLYVANEDLDTLSVYALDPADGLPQLLMEVPVGEAPVHVEFDESGRYVYVLNDGSNDVSVFTVNVSSGVLTPVGSVRTRAEAATLAVYGGQRPALPHAEFLYVVNEESDDVAGFTVDADSGDVTSIGNNVLTGDGPESVAADPLGRFIFVASRTDENVSIFQITPGTGILVESLSRQALGATPGGVAVDPSGAHLYVTLEDADEVVAFSIDPASGALTETDRVPTAGAPRGVAADPTGQFLYVANTGGASTTLSAYRLTDGTFVGGRVDSPAPGSPSGPRFAPGGERLYVALRTANLLVPYGIDRDTGTLTIEAAGSVGTQLRPSMLDLHPSAPFAFAAVPGTAGENGHLTRLAVDAASGALSAIGTSSQGLSPVDLRVDPSGRFLYSVNEDGDDLFVFSIDDASGDITVVTQMAAGLSPQAVVVTLRVD